MCFSTLVSKEANLKDIYESLRKVNAQQVKTGQDNKSSLVVAWSYHMANERKNWIREK